jgi:2-polyprenyl-6-methoxyphenol hydroxylase-like FAD-dependent oxidoreductase
MASGDWSASRLSAGKQPTFRQWYSRIVTRGTYPPPLPQQAEHLLRQHHIAVLAALRLLDANDLLCLVDMLGSKPGTAIASSRTTFIRIISAPHAIQRIARTPITIAPHTAVTRYGYLIVTPWLTPRCRVSTLGDAASAPALPLARGQEALDVTQHNLGVVGLHEQGAVLAQLSCSMGCALRAGCKDDLQPRAN